MALRRSGMFVIWSLLVGAANLGWSASLLPPQGFDAGRAGWEGAPPAVEPTGGPAGDGDPFLLVTATGGNGPGSIVATYSTSEEWVGDLLAVGITGLSVDMMSPLSSNALDMRLVLFGPDNTNNRWTSTTSLSVPNDGQWRNYTFPLSENDIVRVLGTSTYDAVIQDVVRLMLRHDSGTPSSGGTGQSGQLGIDNIAFIAATSSILDCDQDGVIALSDLACGNRVGLTADLLSELGLLPGDLDGDGEVGFSDFLTLSANFATTSDNYLSGDINGVDGVDFGDFLILSANFGLSSDVAAVPEPTNLAQLALISLLSCTRRRR